MDISKIIKRDGREVPFDRQKILNAIIKAANDAGGNIMAESQRVTNRVVERLCELSENNETLGNKNIPDVEFIQDTVEHVLIKEGHAKTAKAYILYRDKRSREREHNTSLMKAIESFTQLDSRDLDSKRENANINTDSAMGTMLKYGTEIAKHYNFNYVVSRKFAKEHEDGGIHIHDADFLTLTETCIQIPLEKLFKGGFNTGHGTLREPQDIRSYAALACIAIQASQNDMHGGQAIPAFDHYMAPGVAKTYIKQIIEIIEDKYDEEDYADFDIKLGRTKKELTEYRNEHRLIMNEEGYKFIKSVLQEHFNFSIKEIERIRKRAYNKVEKATYQAMEAAIANLNSMHSRAGSQVPFSSLNFGTDISTEGRMVIKNFLLSAEEGLGQGETPIFPISIFKMKKGVNSEKGDPNYDLFKLACRVSARQMFPNFSNLDVEFNSKYYIEGNVDSEAAYMGCRTHLIKNIFDPTNQISTGRGNLSFTSINIVRLAILADGDIDVFFELLQEKLELVRDQLLERFEIQCKKHPKNYPFLMGQGLWLGSEKLGPEDDIREILKHGSLAIGFIGLAETLIALTGKHHGESEEAQELGLRIVGYMNDFCDRTSEEYQMNFGVIATPAESLSGRFVKIDKKKFGEIPGVTDKEFYTNSFHVPVYYPISAFKKIDIEAPYHSLTPGGHITYIEIDGDPTKNLRAFEKIVKYMHEKGIGYGAINHPIDSDPVCGYKGIIGDKCPRCGRRDGEPMTQEMWNRLKGYTNITESSKIYGYEDEEASRVSNTIK